MGIESKIIEIIKSLNRFSDAWGKLTLRRTIVCVFTILLLTQVVITTIIYIVEREIDNGWLGIMGLQFGAWGTILAYYFSTRKGKNE